MASSLRDVLKQVPLFSSLSDDDLSLLADALISCEYPVGEWLFFEGDPADRFYILMDGLVDIVKARGTPDERLLAVRKPVAFIGELGLLNPDGRRTASVRARTDLEMYSMTRVDFDRLLHRQPLLAYEMMRVTAGRLQEAENETVRSLREKNEALTLAYEELKAAQAQIVEKRTLERELAMAREIQQSILPHALPLVPGFDFDARMIPSNTVGGDFFDFVPLPGERIGIAIGDVSDKSVPAAIFMALTRSLLRAESYRADSPRAVLENVNRLLLDMNETGMFVTVLYGVLDTRARRFDYVRAGHEMPLLISGESCGVPPRSPGQPLGILREPLMHTACLDLAPGNTLVLYTDGVTETMDARDQPFGLTRLCEALTTMRAAEVRALCDGLIDTLERYRAGVPPHDDIALLAVRAR